MDKEKVLAEEKVSAEEKALAKELLTEDELDKVAGGIGGKTGCGLINFQRSNKHGQGKSFD